MANVRLKEPELILAKASLRTLLSRKISRSCILQAKQAHTGLNHACLHGPPLCRRATWHAVAGPHDKDLALRDKYAVKFFGLKLLSTCVRQGALCESRSALFLRRHSRKARLFHPLNEHPVDEPQCHAYRD